MTVSQYTRMALRHELLRPSGSQYRDLLLAPTGESTADQALEWLAARQPMLKDITTANGHLSPQLRKYLYNHSPLSRLQASRMDRWLCTGRLEEIGLQDGCSKQAVHSCIERAMKRLVKDPVFWELLVELFPESQIDASMLKRALDQLP